MSPFPSPRWPIRRSRPLWFAVLALLLLLAALRVRTALSVQFVRNTTGTPSLSSTATPPRPSEASRQDLPAPFTKPVPVGVDDLKLMQQRVEALVARVSPAVVAVEVGTGTGSGVVISDDGLVLTAGHVCGEPNRQVRFIFPDGTRAHGKTLGLEEDSDTGLMRITDPGHWPHVSMGDVAQTRVGDWVLALGHPGGFDARRSLVVRLGRILRMAPDLVQTDCTINPGDSGGPLLDMAGRVIGVHTAIRSSLAENFHVPINAFYDSWAQLVQEDVRGRLAHVEWASLGAGSRDDLTGCKLSSIEENGAAAKAGLKPGDRVLKVEGRQLLTAAALDHWVAESRPGDTLHLEIKRGEQLFDVAVKLETAPRRD